jgi:hypothetical protein
MSQYAVPGAYPKTYEAPKSPPGGIRPTIIKKPDGVDGPAAVPGATSLNYMEQ